MIVAIHQPNFFPWLGYFDKILRASVFVFLDDVQQQKTGGTWTNRVRLLIAGQARWVTAPTQRAFSGTRTVAETRFDDSAPWRGRLLKSLQTNYGKASFYKEALKLLEPLISSEESRLAAYNMRAICAISSALGLSREFVTSSSLAANGQGTDLLISIVRDVGGDTYLCGGGAQGYQDDVLFKEAGVKLVYQDLKHPDYPQVGGGAFVPGLSIIDALMNCGVEGTRSLLGSSG